MYENEEEGYVLEDDLATILEIMLGVENLVISELFLSMENDTGKTTYGKILKKSMSL